MTDIDRFPNRSCQPDGSAARHTFRMGMQAMEGARRWLAERGVVEAGDEWIDIESKRPLTTNEVAHSWASKVLNDEDLDRNGQARLAFGLLDLLNDYWVTCEIRFANQGSKGPLPANVSGTLPPTAGSGPRLRGHHLLALG
ncbi:hypothetical protein [Streptomyces sp. NPDC056661]|uniref:hypothetical protein n=1 Tax=Streptomyces sp. NPDC056661 TaxID=3345898 RepID=UPI0036C811E9